MKKQNIVILVLVGLLLISQYKLWFGDYGVMLLNRLERELQTQYDENNKLIKRNEALNAQLQELKTGKEALEERARSGLGMIKEGEIFIQETQTSKRK